MTDPKRIEAFRVDWNWAKRSAPQSSSRGMPWTFVGAILVRATRRLTLADDRRWRMRR